MPPRQGCPLQACTLAWWSPTMMASSAFLRLCAFMWLLIFLQRCPYCCRMPKRTMMVLAPLCGAAAAHARSRGVWSSQTQTRRTLLVNLRLPKRLQLCVQRARSARLLTACWRPAQRRTPPMTRQCSQPWLQLGSASWACPVLTHCSCQSLWRWPTECPATPSSFSQANAATCLPGDGWPLLTWLPCPSSASLRFFIHSDNQYPFPNHYPPRPAALRPFAIAHSDFSHSRS